MNERKEISKVKKNVKKKTANKRRKKERKKERKAMNFDCNKKWNYEEIKMNNILQFFNKYNS